MSYETETNPVIEAFYYPCARGLQGGTDTLAIAIRVRGDRRITQEIAVCGKREARKVAAAHNATPWNF